MENRECGYRISVPSVDEILFGIEVAHDKVDMDKLERSALLAGIQVRVVLSCIRSGCDIINAAVFESSAIGEFEQKKSEATIAAQAYIRKHCPNKRKN